MHCDQWLDNFLAAHQQSLIVEPGGHRITNLLETMWSQSWTSLSSSCLDKKLSVLFVTPILVMSSMTVHDQPENDIASTGLKFKSRRAYFFKIPKDLANSKVHVSCFFAFRVVLLWNLSHWREQENESFWYKGLFMYYII